MKIAIRDDDLSYWTTYTDFRKVYDFLNCPVSISVVPFGTDKHCDFSPYGQHGTSLNMPIDKNEDLVKGIRSDIAQKKCEILLHGFTHQYKKIGDTYIPEMLWRDEAQILRLMPICKNYLQKVFNVGISIFIAPSDKMKKQTYAVLKENCLSTCSLIGTLNSRPFCWHTISNFIKRWRNRFKYGFPYCGVMKYSGWSEIQTYQRIEYDYLVSVYKMLKKNNFPMVVETHYWQLLNNSNMLLTLKKFISYLKDNNEEICLLSDILGKN